jgi:hypothetical protein
MTRQIEVQSISSASFRFEDDALTGSAVHDRGHGLVETEMAFAAVFF